MNAVQEKLTQSGVHSLSPHLICAGASDAIEFYKQAFGATEMMRIPGEQGKVMHARVSINGSSVMLVDENRDYGMLGPKELKGTPVTMHLIVDDADSVVDKAVAAGAKVIMPVADMFWGDRYGLLEDPFGHRWAVATPQRSMAKGELQQTAKAAMRECGSIPA